ncbi:MAG: DUF4236 domain-containing protein [Nitrosomonadales bacterium]|nr:DUF4236 domain-containing protein [Nitrosomonadales bacterium]
MGVRFRRSIKLAPGLRLNFSGSGVSLSAGPRGASVNFGSRGTFVNTGIPGTGLYSRSRLGAATSESSGRPGKVNVTASVKVGDDGTVTFLDSNGQPLSDYLTNLAKRQQGAKIRELLEQTCSEINAETEALGRIHCHTPKPDDAPQYIPLEFPQPEPKHPVLKGVGLIARLLGKRVQIEAKEAEARRLYNDSIARWHSEKALFEAQQEEESKRFDERLRRDQDFMQQVLEENLCAITWPRETLVSFEINREGKSVAIDIDLPEIEDMQRKIASVPQRGYKLNLKEVKGKPLQALYSQHVHGVGFRIAGEIFASLPTVQDITLSAFTQRVDPATGHHTDTYVYSANISRSIWDKINFDNLSVIDVVSAFEQFELRRKISRSEVLEGILPFTTN